MIPRHIQIALVLLLAALFAGGIYMLKLTQREEVRARLPVASGPLADSSREKVSMLIAYDDDGVVRRENLEVSLTGTQANRTKDILRELIRFYGQRPSPHPLSPGADVRNVFVLENGLCVVDLNAAFAEGHRSGVLVERLTIASFVETVASNLPGVTKVKFLVEGQDRQTLAGHADLKVTYDVTNVREMVKEME